MAILELVSNILDIGKTVAERLIPDKALAARLDVETRAAIIDAQLKGELAQIDLNKVEAANPSVFVSGWRPFIGWVCGAALAYEFVLTPFSLWVTAIVGLHIAEPPKLDEVLWQLMFGMLGMGTLRTVEKHLGVAAKQYGQRRARDADRSFSGSHCRSASAMKNRGNHACINHMVRGHETRTKEQ